MGSTLSVLGSKAGVLPFRAVKESKRESVRPGISLCSLMEDINIDPKDTDPELCRNETCEFYDPLILALGPSLLPPTMYLGSLTNMRQALVGQTRGCLSGIRGGDLIPGEEPSPFTQN